MKKYNLSNIMRRAWEIKKQNAANIFSLCLKMAWKEAKKMEETKKVEMKGSPKQVKWANDIIDKAINKARINREKEINLLVEIEAADRDIKSVKNGMKIQGRFFEKIREYGDAALIIKKRFLINPMANNFCGNYLYSLIEMGDDIETNAVLCKDSRTVYRGRVENEVSDGVIDLIASELANRLMSSELR